MATVVMSEMERGPGDTLTRTSCLALPRGEIQTTKGHFLWLDRLIDKCIAIESIAARIRTCVGFVAARDQPSKGRFDEQMRR